MFQRKKEKKKTEVAHDAQQENKNVIQIEAVPALTTRKIAATLFDGACIAVVALLLISLVLSPLLNLATHYNKAQADYETRLVQSHLYVEIEDRTYELRELKKDKKTEEYLTFLDEHLQAFYLDEEFPDTKIETYNKAKENSKYFILTEEEDGTETWVPKAGTTQEELMKFYEKEVENAIHILAHDDLCITLARKITVHWILVFSLGILIPILIFCLLFPMILRNRCTLGKKICGIGVISRKDGLIAKRSQMCIRFLVFLLLEVVLSVFLLGIPMLISFTMMCFMKEGTSLHDYLSATITVDTRACLLFKTKEEYLQYLGMEENI